MQLAKNGLSFPLFKTNQSRIEALLVKIDTETILDGVYVENWMAIDLIAKEKWISKVVKMNIFGFSAQRFNNSWIGWNCK